MNLLYLPAHSILEFDEYKLFTELGHDVFSLGSYISSQFPHDSKRPALEGKLHEQLIGVSQVHTKDNLHEEQVMWADVIIIQHIPQWVSNNWPLFSKAIMDGKRVVWRTIGQSTEQVERHIMPYRAMGLEIVRYSPREENIPGYIGGDAMIRFYKDPDEFKGWNGHDERVVSFSQAMKTRKDFCHFPVFDKATHDLKRTLYGPGNENCDMSGGVLDYEDMKQVMRDARVFFYTGTQPASYTLSSIEAQMSGMPMVSIGPKYANSIFQMDTFEIPDFIDNGVNGFWSDDIGELHDYTKALLDDYSLAKRISKAGRETAIELFGVEKIRAQWKEFLER